MRHPSFPKDYFVIDVGMHTGSDSEYYALRGFKVIAFEANPLLATAARTKFSAAGLPVHVINSAVSGQSRGTARFYINHHSDQFSSLDSSIGSRFGSATAITVDTCHLGEQLQHVSSLIHMIKIDIEGEDYNALEQLRQSGISPPYISVENGGRRFVEKLSSMGYTRFKFANQKFNSKHWIPRNSPHGDYIKHFFPAHSSGPFGEDLPGRWLTADEANAVGDALAAARRLAPNHLFAEAIGWFDMHAAL